MRFTEDAGRPPRRRRFDDEDDRPPVRRRPETDPSLHRLQGFPDLTDGRPGDGDAVAPDAPPTGDAWTTWGDALHGPRPHPDWVITALGAVDTELGVLKTGKEADVHLVERALPDGSAATVLAAKRYRSSEHRMFHRDAGYVEGRRMRRSRENRAMARRTGFGRELLAGQWAMAEFEALGRLWELGAERGAISVPYPVQLRGTEVMLEFVGEPDGTAAPRLAQLRPEPDELVDLWRQLEASLQVLALAQLAHGDLSPYNVLVHRGRLVLIDLPQVVDVVGNPRGPEFLARDVAVMAAWFRARGLPAELGEPERLTGLLLADAGLRA